MVMNANIGPVFKPAELSGEVNQIHLKQIENSKQEVRCTFSLTNRKKTNKPMNHLAFSKANEKQIKTSAKR